METITLLELLEILEQKGRYINYGKVIISFNNRLVHRRILQEVYKPNSFAQDVGAEIAQIRWLIKKIAFEIELELIRGY